MYKLMLADIRMLLIVQMYRKRKRYILLTMYVFFFFDFQRSKSGFMLILLNIFHEQKWPEWYYFFITIARRIEL